MQQVLQRRWCLLLFRSPCKEHRLESVWGPINVLLSLARAMKVATATYTWDAWHVIKVCLPLLSYEPPCFFVGRLACDAANYCLSPPPQCSFGCHCCFFCLFNLCSEALLKIVSEHARWTSFDNFANVRCDSNAAKICQAPHPRKEDVDTQPVNVVVGALVHL